MVKKDVGKTVVTLNLTLALQKWKIMLLHHYHSCTFLPAGTKATESVGLAISLL